MLLSIIYPLGGGRGISCHLRLVFRRSGSGEMSLHYVWACSELFGLIWLLLFSRKTIRYPSLSENFCFVSVFFLCLPPPPPPP